MSTSKPLHCCSSNGGIVSYVTLIVFAVISGESLADNEQCLSPVQEAGSSDASVLYQHNIRVKSELRSLALGEDKNGPGGLEALWLEDGSLLSDLIGSDELASFAKETKYLHLGRDDKPKVQNVTTKGENAMSVNISNDDDNNTDNADVTTNTTDIKVERKVVQGDKKRHVVNSKVHTRTNKSTGNKTEIDKEEKEGEEETATGGKKEGNETQGKKEAFAKENVTVKRHMLNITRQDNASHNHTQNVTITETVRTVNLASSFHIVSIYLVLFVPVFLAWWAYINNGQQAIHYIWLLPFTMCTMSIGQDLVNQSLTIILEAPNAISAIQGFAMTISTGCWVFFVDWPAVKAVSFNSLSGWWGVALCFAVYQLMNHLVYATCSLSERTVITNLSPLVTLFVETLVMPVALKPGITVGAKMALSLMVFGALLFSLQNPDFSARGLCVALILLVTTVPYRIAQRRFLAGGPDLPLSLLACIDGFFLGAPSVIISATRKIHFWSVMDTSTEIPVFIMLALSIVTFVGLHLSGLAMLRAGPATTYLVFSNIASLVTVALGIFFFGDNALATTLATIGLIANVGSGIWYSAEVHRAADPDEKVIENQRVPKDVEN